MPLLDTDRFLWIAVLVGVGTAYFSVPVLLQQVKDAARAPPQDAPAPAKRLQKDSENSLKIETLRTLADGYSYDLRTSAIKIVASRTVRSASTKKLLLRDLASKEFSRRDNAINGLWMLLYHPSLDGTRISGAFNDVATVDAVVTALINVLPLHAVGALYQPKPNEKKIKIPPSPLRPLHRPAHEVSLLIILNNILHQVTLGVDAAGTNLSPTIRRLITQWLAHYPFPCSLPAYSHFNYKKRDVMRLFVAMPSEDPLMAEIFKELQKYSGLLRPLRDAGLLGQPELLDYPDGSRGYQWNVQPWFDEDNDVQMTDGEDTAGGGGWGAGTSHPSAVRRGSFGGGVGEPARSRERSVEEEHLRRRHRQAIVVAERGTPLSRENILQREDSRVGLQPMHSSGTRDGEGELNRLLNLSADQNASDVLLQDTAPHQPLDLLAPDDNTDDVADHTAGDTGGSIGPDMPSFEIQRDFDVRELPSSMQAVIMAESDVDRRRAIDGVSSADISDVLELAGVSQDGDSPHSVEDANDSVQSDAHD